MLGGKPLDSPLSPIGVLQRWPSQRPIALLHSGRPHPRWSRQSILAQPDHAITFDGKNLHDSAGNAKACDDPFAALQQEWDRDPDALWIGYLGYDLGRWVEQIPSTASDDRPWPILQFQRCPGWLVFDTVNQTWSGHGSWRDGQVLAELPPYVPLEDEGYRAGPPNFEQMRTQYEQAVQRAKDYIAAGDIFQANLAHRLHGSFSGDPRRLFAKLSKQSPAWYSAYLEPWPVEPGGPARSVCSISPELFLECSSEGAIVTRPIKGTLSADLPASQLVASEKDAAELAMIVDLLRNDLGRVCEVGSVQVQQGRAIETHPTVHHGVATVTGKLSPRHDIADLLRATLPGGSITGAPKVRAMQIIEELEPNRRGVYCGAIGWVQGRAMSLNIAIRTLLIEQTHRGEQGQYHFSVGGGIVADSTPAAEYDETISKAQTLLRGLAHSLDQSQQHQAQQ